MKKIILGLSAVLSLGLSGCASDGGSATIGQHGKDSTLSGNKLAGLYLFKIETNQNVITITSEGDARVGL